MTWSILLPILLSVAKDVFGPLVAKLLEKLLSKTGGPVPLGWSEANVTMKTDSLEGKEQLKEFVKNLIQSQLDKWTWVPPVLKNILTQVIDALDGVFIDLVWQRLFQKQLVTVPVKVKLGAAGDKPEAIEVPPEAAAAYESEFGEAAPE